MMQASHHNSTVPTHRRASLSSSSSFTDTVSDLHTELLLSPFPRSTALTPSMLNKYYEELESARHLQRLQRASTSQLDARSAMGSSLGMSSGAASLLSARFSGGAESRRISAAAYAFPPSAYGGGGSGSMGTTATSSPRTSSCSLSLSSMSLSPSGGGVDRFGGSSLRGGDCESSLSGAGSGLQQSCCSSSSVAATAAANAMLGGTPHPPSPPMECTMEYLADLVKEKKQLEIFPQSFNHVERLVDEEINRVRLALFQCDFATDDLHLPEPEGEVVTITEKLYVPRREYPEYNFVGRILGPRGMTAKQLEQETGCKIMVRGKGSMRDKRKEEANRGKPNWEHLDDELHVLIQCEDTANRAVVKMQVAAEHVKKLLIPAPEGTDELKRKQLMELAIINGTYRPFHGKPPNGSLEQSRLLTMVPQSALRSSIYSVSPGGSPSPLNSSNLIHPLSFPSVSSSPGLDFSTVMNQSLLDSFISTYNLGSTTGLGGAASSIGGTSFNGATSSSPLSTVTSPTMTDPPGGAFGYGSAVNTSYPGNLLQSLPASLFESSSLL
ncbi:gld-1 [Pristionchus pacificus]|uniref:GLD-1 n=1 Tax=Pristionchus pacificus TaxID=54126 RepID=M9YXH4_PRIPA|nr:GLD-1 [Pristionchus pacificus]KAF8384564.1 gld-1 [Pristionchus pacificus]